ncbi:YcxB family protein [Agrobacterium sp. SORGH_AS 787]|uniref:YcxB family protein n=1 Tax=Agrobacterium sp. SORGH_AS 787 TaxID=3041775 RepID=UPI002787317F|nr:hypothetical protein [Rhizobium sp. SORGH_AS_0787]
MVQTEAPSTEGSTVRYLLSPDEFANGYEHFQRKNRTSYIILAAGLALFLAATNYRIASSDTASLSDYLQANLLAFPFVLFLLYFYRVYSLNRVRKSVMRSPFLKSELTTAWDENALIVRTEDAFQRYDWTKFECWTEDLHIFTLFIQPNWYIPLPKRAFTPALQDSLRAQLTRTSIPFIKLMPF